MRTILITTILALLAGTALAEPGVVRLCVSAGRLFPETEADLRAAVTRYLDEAQPPVPNAPLAACVVPHGPYGISGKIAAAAFKHLKPGQYTRVIVLAASHAEMDFEDCSIDAVDAYATPMGFVPLDKAAVRTLTYSALFSTRSLRYNHEQRGFLTESERKPLHEYEHAIELVLPFLQERLGDFKLVPILVGQLTNATGQFSESRAETVADQLSRIIDDKTLLVVSTDFTHFGNDFSYRPFDNDIFNRIEKLDNAGLERLADNNFDEFEDFVRKTKVPICGHNALRVMLKLLPKNAKGTLLARDTSGRFYNDENRSVSYASMNFYLTERPRPSIQPDPVEATRLAPLPEAEQAPATVKMQEAPAIIPPEAQPTAPEVSTPQPEPAPEPTPAAKPAPAPQQPAGPRPAPIDLTNIKRNPAP